MNIELREEYYYEGVKQGIVVTVLGLFMMNKITEEIADQYIDSYKDEKNFEDIHSIYEEHKKSAKEKLKEMGKL